MGKFLGFLFVILTLNLIVIHISASDEAFNDYQAKYGKKYVSSSAKSQAKANHEKNVKAIQAHNADTNQTYKQGENDMTDMTDQEAKRVRCGVNGTKVAQNHKQDDGNITVSDNKGKRVKMSPAEFLKSSKNGKNVKATTNVTSLNLTSQFPPITNQSKCGSCWAFTVTSLIDNVAMKNSSTIKYSEQNVLDCSLAGSCDGGDPIGALWYTFLAGVASEAAYGPYKSAKDYCKSVSANNTRKSKQFGYTTNGNEALLYQVLTTYGVGVGVVVSVNSNFMRYKNGVFKDSTCPKSLWQANHALTVVGFGTDSALGNYWILRNSWSTSWGEDGHMRIARGVNQCGVGNMLYAVLK